LIAYIFPGQGSQFVGMGKSLVESNQQAQAIFKLADNILGFNISEIMVSGSIEDLKQTKVTQPAIFIHSIATLHCISTAKFEVVSGHSLGEFSSLVANGALSFEDGLKLVSIRAQAMQKACENTPGTMAAILGLENSLVEEICHSIKGETVVPANYNCPNQIVISGSVKGIEIACKNLIQAGAKRALILNVGGAFHSPLMESAREELSKAIESTTFEKPNCPIYQNVNAKSSTSVSEIKSNLIEQLTAPVLWSQSINQMVADGAKNFTEVGPGKVLQGLVKKIAPQSEVSGF